MKLDLREMPIFVLNMKEDTRRKQFMSDQLSELGLNFEFVSAIKASPSPIGVAISHLKIIRNPQLKPPFLVLEDDCRFLMDLFSYEYEVPDETDALYLGHSEFGLRDKKDQYGIRWGEQGNIKYKNYSEQYIRVFNMLARHAVIYLSDKFVSSAIQANLSALLDHDFTIPGDIMYAEMQPSHIILAPKEISCYQSGQYGGVEGATKNSVLDRIPAYEGSDY